MQAWDEFLPIIITVTARWTLDPSLRRVLLHLLAPVTSSLAVPVDILHPEYSMLITTQQSIGIDSLLFGFLSTEWVHLQDRYLRAHSLPCSQNQATRAISSLIMTLHEQCHMVWLLRNQHLHGADPNNLTSYKHLHLLAQIQELHDASPHMMRHDRDLLAFPMECRRLQSTATLNTFYRQAKPIVEQSLEDAQKLGRNFRRILHPEYTMLLTTQQSIGVNSVLFGFFSTKWGRLQDRYLRARAACHAHRTRRPGRSAP
jgi:hypothetical protein